MTVLSRPLHPITSKALEIARAWCAGHVIDGAPALGHAVRVALKLGEHVPDAPPELVAAVLLHDAPEFAPPGEDLDATLTDWLGAGVVRVVRALEQEHQALADQAEPAMPTDDPSTLCGSWTLHASAADKIVSLTSILRRAAAADDPDAYWRERRPFVALLPYLRTFHTVSAPHLPATMTSELGNLVTIAERMTGSVG
ncbi:MAG: HD domain-containing protein [Egibacteraceae bacterium]